MDTRTLRSDGVAKTAPSHCQRACAAKRTSAAAAAAAAAAVQPEASVQASPPAPDPWARHVPCTRCPQGHFGAGGGAGLLLVRRNHTLLDAPATHIVLQHRSNAVHMGNTWSLPGGALDYGETPVQAALREGREETNLPAVDDGLIIVREQIALLQHPTWKYTTVIADVMCDDWVPRLPPDDWESWAVEWVPIAEVADGRRVLHPAFRDAWGTLLAMITRRDRALASLGPAGDEGDEDSGVDELS